MNKFSARKQDLGGWSAKFGEETRNHRHPCKYSEGQYDVFTFTRTIMNGQPAYNTMCLLVNFLNFKRIITGYPGLKV